MWGEAMGDKKKKHDYERVDVTFAKDNEEEMQLYNYLEENSKLLGKAKYMKQLLLKDIKGLK